MTAVAEGPPDLVAGEPVRPDRGTAAGYPLTVLHCSIRLDGVGPAEALRRLCPAAEDVTADAPGFLLESAGTDDVGRWSTVGFRPRPLPTGADPSPELERIAATPLAPTDGLPPFVGGAVGYLGWESARHAEPRLPRAGGPGPDLPESAFLLAETLAVFDHATGEVVLTTLHRPDTEDYDDATARLHELHTALRTPAAPVTAPERPAGADWRATADEDVFTERVARAQEHIAAGEVFQVVLSRRFTRPLGSTPLELYRALRATNPSPYLYLLALGGGRYVIGASPELLVRSDGDRVRTRPLAGTRPRGATPAADAEREAELLADPKERAEHVMLVDLGRNDVGRVCTPGTVEVERFAEVERYSHVMHLSSTVAGRLDPARSGVAALRAAFPAGTLSGAPKIRAMELIAELEGVRRGVYGGALGTVGYGGDVDVAIVLRTFVVADGEVHVQSGAGVVAGSDPAAEYAETGHKAAALFAAADRAERRR